MNTTKRIIIEATAIGLPICGLYEYARQLCPRLVLNCPENMRFTFIVPKGKKGCFGDGAEYYEVGKFQIWMLKNLPILKGDLFHAIHQLCRVKRFHGTKIKLLTIHDINFEHTKTGRSYQHAKKRFLQRLNAATHLAFITKFARQDVALRYPSFKPSRIIYNGVTAPNLDNSKQPGNVTEDKFLFHLSSLEPYKRAELLVEMMDYLPDKTLVIAGRCRNQALIQMMAQRENVKYIGEVSDEEKAWLYQHCKAFLFPSMAEGFGLPPVEAMLCGKQTFLAQATSLPEIGAEVAFFWPDLTPEKMATFIEEKLGSAINTEKIIAHANQFSWDKCANEYINYYQEILSND